MKHRLSPALPAALALLLCALWAGRGMQPSGAYFAHQVTIEGLQVQAGFWVSPTPSPTPTATATPIQLAAAVTIAPKQIKKGDTAPIQASITLPKGYNVEAIDPASILLCRGTAPCASGIAPASTAQGDGLFTATFDRPPILALLAGVQPPAWVDLAVSGRVESAIFLGSAQVHVQQGALGPAAEPPAAAPALAPTDTPTPTSTPTEPPAPSDTPPPTAAEAPAEASATPTPASAGEPTPVPTTAQVAPGS